MTAKPRALLAYAPELNRELLTAGHLERLGRLCELPSNAPVQAFEDAAGVVDLARTEVLITGWGAPVLDAAALDRLPRLRAVFHAAGSVKLHVTRECFERGIRVTSAAAANAIPVAEFTVGAILLGNKRIFSIERRYRRHRAYRSWAEEFPGLGNHGRTVGIVGASRVGRLVLERLRPFGFDLLLHDPFLGDAEARSLGAARCELDDLVRRSDVVSLHAPSVRETHHMIDARRLGLLRDGALLVNTARGALVDQDALADEILSGRIYAVLDTTDPEILPAESPLYESENVLLTPHVAGSLGPETRRMLDAALDELERFVGGEPLHHEVRHEDWDRVA